MTSRRRYRCRCGTSCPPGCRWPSAPMALCCTTSASSTDQMGPYLERMRTECIATVPAEAFEVVEEDSR